ncbi:MAG: hypothetical protein J6N52_12170 [Clostridia bacterium]|nr:hypothetical protein [Clostridia bacterium]
MGYWIFILMIFAILGLMIFFAWHSITKEKDLDNLRISIIGICLVGILSVYFGIDIPNALAGGQEIYVDKFPDVVNTNHLQFIGANGKYFISFVNYNPEKYEQNAEYHITYTKFTNSILDIEKVEK